MARQTLDQWIREALIDDTKDGKCTSIALIHISSGGKECELHAIKFGAKAWDPKELAALFRGKAENHAADIVGAQTYNLLAFYADRSEPQGRKPFILQGEHDTHLMTEPPTKEGQVMQGMRHMEATIQIALAHSRTLTESTNRLVDILSRQNASLMQENREAFDIVKELIMARVTAQNEDQMKRLEYQRKSEERKIWFGMIPALVNSVVGKEIFPQANADSALLETIAETLDEDAIQKLATIIKPEIWAPLAERMNQSLRAKRLREENRPASIARANGIDPDVELQ